MELRHLEYFAAVAQMRSVRKAAALLHTSQPSLSRQVRALETELGHPLFDRSHAGVALTPAGAGLYRHLGVLFPQLRQIPEVVRRAAAGERIVRIGIPQGAPHSWLRALVAAVRESAPGISLNLQEATTDEQRRLVATGTLDLALLHYKAPELETRMLWYQPIGLAVEPDAPLAHRTSVTFHDLAGLRVMAHAVGEVNGEESRLRAAAEAAAVDVTWIFRRFSQYSDLIADTSRVDAVLVTEASAERSLPDHAWLPLRDRDVNGRPFGTRTWLAWAGPVGADLAPVIEAVLSAKRPVPARDAGR